jgi:hypothetical protein
MVPGFQTVLVLSSSDGRSVVPSLVRKYVSESLKNFFVLGKAADYHSEAFVARSIRFWLVTLGLRSTNIALRRFSGLDLHLARMQR